MAELETQLNDEIRRSGDLEAALRHVQEWVTDEAVTRSSIAGYIKATLDRVGL